MFLISDLWINDWLRLQQNHQWIRTKITLKLLLFFCSNTENFQAQRLYNFTFIQKKIKCNLFLKYVQKKYNKVQRPSFITNFVGLNNASNVM